jgi:hypothetical protein
MTELDPEVRELLDRWAASPAMPVSELTAQAVREDDLAVLDLQRAPASCTQSKISRPPGRRARCPYACIDRARDGYIPCSSSTRAASWTAATIARR